MAKDLHTTRPSPERSAVDLLGEVLTQKKRGESKLRTPSRPRMHKAAGNANADYVLLARVIRKKKALPRDDGVPTELKVLRRWRKNTTVLRAPAISSPVADRSPVTDLRTEAERIGVPLGPEPDESRAAKIVWALAGSARDLFANDGAARRALFERPLDGSGRTAVDLVRERGAAAVLLKLDQMRFGANG